MSSLSPEGIQAALDSVPAIIWIADANTFRITYVNRWAESILGYTRQQWMEPDFWVRHVHPDDQLAIEQCLKAIEDHKDHVLVYRMVAADGQAVWFRDTVHVRVVGGVVSELYGAMMDITSEREAHQALVQSEEGYRRIARESADAIGIHTGGKFVFVNHRFVELFGARSEQDLLGQEALTLAHPDHLAQIRERLQRLAAGESVPPLRQRLFRLDGGLAEADIWATPIQFNGLPSIQVVAREVTDRVRSEERLQLLAAASNEAIWEADLVSGRFWCNEACRDLFGTSQSLEEACTRIIERLHPRDRDATTPKFHQRMAGQLDRWSEEYRVRRPSGDWIWVHDRGRTIRDESGKPVRMIGAILDVTRLREAEMSYRQIFESVRDVIYIVDERGRILSLNPAFETLTGFPVENWIGRSIAELFTPESVTRAFEHLAAILTGGRAATHLYQMRNAAGGLVELEVSVQPRIVSGRVVGMLGVARDVTERNRLTRNLEDARRISSLGQLAASIAHELNNVLMSIQPFVEILLRQSPATDKTNTAARYITEAIARGKRVTSEILLFANPKEPDVEPLETAGWLATLTSSLRATLPPQIRIELIPGDVTFLCDRYQLEQVVANLATNARDAMPGGGIFTVEVSAEVEPWRSRAGLDPARRYGRITVSDTGTGMSEETLSRLWEPLFTTKRSGTGLGLPIARKLIEAHRGAMDVETTPGKGTRFHILLPLAEGTHTVATSDPQARRELNRVLLVEDDAAVATGLSTLFALEGIDCHHVATGAEVAEAIPRVDPQAVILDVNLPDVSGTVLHGRIREKRPDLPIILSTGHLLEFQPDPLSEVVLKPYAFDDLLDACHRLMERNVTPPARSDRAET